MIVNPKTAEEAIVNLLSKGSLNSVELHKMINTHWKSITKQAFYKALRKLKDEETVVVGNKRVSLSHLWIKKMLTFFEKTSENYLSQSHFQSKENFLGLQEGERISYYFNSFNSADVFWGHVFGVLSHSTDNSIPICVYDPHEWFLVVRNTSETALFNDVRKLGRHLFVLIGHSEPIDREMKKYFDGEMCQYHILDTPYFVKKNYYVNVFDDFILEAYLDEEGAEEIDAVYKKYPKVTLEVTQELTKIISKEKKCRIVVSRNRRKAKIIQKVFLKYFFIKK